MLTLYQFPNSHYCEKIRWALAYKKLNFRIVNLLPGFHQFASKRYSLPSSSLPILVDDGLAIQNSSAIITYLDEKYPDSPLTPTDATLRQEALDWEHFADEQFGIPVRTICYQTLLDHPKILIPMFTDNGPWYGKYLMRLIFPILRTGMKKSMNINQATEKAAERQLAQAMEKLHLQLQHRQFLVGCSFSRADLAAASLLAPLTRPEQYGINWPKPYPEELETIISQHREKLIWVDYCYNHYR
jgi:glutathione S-transferase